MSELDGSPSSVCRWLIRPQPCRKTGGKQREKLVGKDLLLLSIFLFAYPDASADQMSAFVWNNGGDMCAQQEISARMKDVGMSKKVSSTEACQAFLPVNVRKARRFWNCPPPLGVVGVEHRRLTDVDEMGISLEQTNTKHGHAHKSVRIQKPGHHTRSTKLTVTMAVEPGDPSSPPHVDGSIARPRIWIMVREVGGTNAVEFASFCNCVCADLEQHPAPGDLDLHRVFLWDNLMSHHTPIVAQTVEGRPSQNVFQIVPRPPCQPKFGPIECFFAELGVELEKRVQPDWTIGDLKGEIPSAASVLFKNGNSNNTFVHCGFV